MNFDQGVHTEPARLLDHVSGGLVIEQRQHDENRVSARNPRFGDLTQVDEEVLGQDRPIELASRGRQVVERAAEIFGVAQHAQRIANPGITARQLRGIRAGADRTLGR